MLKQLQNIDTAFKYVRLFSFFVIIGVLLLCAYVTFLHHQSLRKREGKVMVIANGKIFEAMAEDRAKYWPIEIRDHVKMFHFYFFTLHPDEKSINRNLNNAFYLADNSAKAEYDNLREKGYYNALIAANVSQEIEVDSISVNINSTPWRFTYFGTIQIIRATTIVTRSLVTEGLLRKTIPSDNNNHGLIIENWRIVENKDINHSNR